MEKAGDAKPDINRLLNKTRMVGRFLRRDKKTVNCDENDDVSTFLNGPSDKLHMTDTVPTRPPIPSRLDMSKAQRWPTAAEVRHTRDSSRGRSVSLKRNKKGLLVRFTDQQPEIIGQGGDEAEEPPSQISASRKRAYSHPPTNIQLLQVEQHSAASTQDRNPTGRNSESDTFRPQPIRRIQTGHTPTAEPSTGSQARMYQEFNSHRSEVTASNDCKPLSEAPTGKPADFPSYGSQMQPGTRTYLGRTSLEKFKDTPLELVDAGSHHSVLRKGSDGRPSQSTTAPPGTHFPRKIQAAPPTSEVQDTIGLEHARDTKSRINSVDQPEEALKSVRLAVLDHHHTATSLLSSSITSGGDALEDFSARVQHLFKLFLLSAESVVPLKEPSVEDWIRAASWWFLRGRAGIEQAAHNRPSSSDGQLRQELFRQQAHADLAKSSWIITEVVPQRPEMGDHALSNLDESLRAARSRGDAYDSDVIDRRQAILSNLRKLAMSMKRNNLLPPSPDDAPLSSGIDHTIWVAYPPSTPDLAAILSGSSSFVTGPQVRISDALPLGDTTQAFNYGRMFVDLCLEGEGLDPQQFRYTCVLSICRKCLDRNLTIMLSSQNGLVTLCIQPDKSQGLSWHDVRWHTSIASLDIHLSRGLVARIHCSPHDYKTLWGMYDYTSKTHSNIQSRKDEALLYENTVKSFQYFSHDPQGNFPRELLHDCHVRIFEKTARENIGVGTFNKHHGFRIALVTNVNMKKLSGISQDLSSQVPIRYNFMRAEGDLQALLLGFGELAEQTTMILGFGSVKDRAKCYECLVGWPQNYEIVLAHIGLEEYQIENATDVLGMPCLSFSSKGQEIRVIDERSSDSWDPVKPKRLSSHTTRLLVSSRECIVNDRFSIGSAELKFCLATQLQTCTLVMLRKPQDDMTLCITEGHNGTELDCEMRKALHTVANRETKRTYRFSNIEDLHRFQTAITGFSILFDGMANSFNISRRRMVVPIHKRWEAPISRLQIVKQDKIVQLVAFFEGFSHGDCMNFALRATDAFETFSKGGSFSVRLVDAKFAIPKGASGNDERHEGIDKCYVSLDEPDFPSEHDDIIISFDSEAMRGRFAEALPAPVKAVSRLGTVRR
ncbi:MAG: hypothetical protein M1818_003414 [Claussenomyces sp. TS43310]|nr:MAG: hypothetical protein M1818_003414 [Claussenomyces sp. TS43310]